MSPHTQRRSASLTRRARLPPRRDRQVNHFPDTWCIGRKDRLARAVTRKQRQHPTQFDFMAKSYVLPYDAEELSRDLDAHPRVRRRPPAGKTGGPTNATRRDSRPGGSGSGS